MLMLVSPIGVICQGFSIIIDLYMDRNSLPLQKCRQASALNNMIYEFRETPSR